MIGDPGPDGQNAQPEDPPEEVVLAAHELAEALTAAGNFITAAMKLCDAGDASHDRLSNALVGASRQHERAGVAAHRVFQLLIPGWSDPRR